MQDRSKSLCLPGVATPPYRRPSTPVAPGWPCRKGGGKGMGSDTHTHNIKKSWGGRGGRAGASGGGRGWHTEEGRAGVRGEWVAHSVSHQHCTALNDIQSNTMGTHKTTTATHTHCSVCKHIPHAVMSDNIPHAHAACCMTACISHMHAYQPCRNTACLHAYPTCHKHCMHIPHAVNTAFAPHPLKSLVL